MEIFLIARSAMLIGLRTREVVEWRLDVTLDQIPFAPLRDRVIYTPLSKLEFAWAILTVSLTLAECRPKDLDD